MGGNCKISVTKWTRKKQCHGKAFEMIGRICTSLALVCAMKTHSTFHPFAMNAVSLLEGQDERPSHVISWWTYSTTNTLKSSSFAQWRCLSMKLFLNHIDLYTCSPKLMFYLPRRESQRHRRAQRSEGVRLVRALATPAELIWYVAHMPSPGKVVLCHASEWIRHYRQLRICREN